MVGGFSPRARLRTPNFGLNDLAALFQGRKRSVLSLGRLQVDIIARYRIAST